MFDNLIESKQKKQRRFGQTMFSLAVHAVLIFLAIKATQVVATAEAKPEVDTTMSFLKPPEPPPEPPPPAATPDVKQMRPKANRPKLDPPDKVSDEKLKESDKELAAGDAAGPVDGFLDGVEGGQGNMRPPPPPPKPAGVVRPPSQIMSTFVQPRYSSKAKRKGIEGVVVVSFEVAENGTVRNLKIISGAPELIEMVIPWSAKWRFKPATRDGKPIPYRKTLSIRFRLEDA